MVENYASYRRFSETPLLALAVAVAVPRAFCRPV